MHDELQGLDVVIAYVLQHGNRNWHADWRHQPQSAPGLFTSRQAASKAAHATAHEDSEFYLREVPAFCLKSPNGLTIIADYLHPKPFDGIATQWANDFLRLGQSTEAIGRYLTLGNDGKPRTPSLITMQLEANTPTTSAARKRLNNWWSLPLDETGALQWCADESTIDRRRMRALQAEFLKVNAPEQVAQQDSLFADQHSDDPGDPIRREFGRGLQELMKFLSDGDSK